MNATLTTLCISSVHLTLMCWISALFPQLETFPKMSSGRCWHLLDDQWWSEPAPGSLSSWFGAFWRSSTTLWLLIVETMCKLLGIILSLLHHKLKHKRILSSGSFLYVHIHSCIIRTVLVPKSLVIRVTGNKIKTITCQLQVSIYLTDVPIQTPTTL